MTCRYPIVQISVFMTTFIPHTFLRTTYVPFRNWAHRARRSQRPRLKPELTLAFTPVDEEIGTKGAHPQHMPPLLQYLFRSRSYRSCPPFAARSGIRLCGSEDGCYSHLLNICHQQDLKSHLKGADQGFQVFANRALCSSRQPRLARFLYKDKLRITASPRCTRTTVLSQSELN